MKSYQAARSLLGMWLGLGVSIVQTFVVAALLGTLQRAVAQEMLAEAMSATLPTESARKLPEITITGTAIDDSYSLPNASTATKVDIPIIETPATIAVIPQQVILDQRAMGLDQVLMNVAGVYSTGYEPSLAENIFIRGFNTSQTLWNGFRIDEYSTTGHGIVGAVLTDNSEKVEVLSGPASILYGRVEPGGVVNVVTKQPLDHYFGAATLTLGSWRQLWSGIDVTGPTNEERTVLYRINASAQHSGSWLWGTNSGTLALAPVVECRISSATTIALEGQFEKATTEGGGQLRLIDPATGQPIPGRRQYASPLENSSAIDLSRVMARLEHRFNSDWMVSAKALHTLSSSPVQTDTYLANAHFPAAGTNNLPIEVSVSAFDSLNRTDAGVIDVVGHLRALGMQHTILVGGDYYHQGFHFNTPGSCCYPMNYYSPAPLPPGAVYTPKGPNGYYYGSIWNVSNRNFGAYAQDQVKLPWDLQVLAGVRYQHAVSTSETGFNADPTTPPVPVSSPANQDHTFDPRIGVLWHPEGWITVYYTYSTNFGINNGFAFGGLVLPPEKAKQNEIGVKTEFLGGKLISTAAIYELTKYHVSAGDINHPNFSVTIGQVESKGIEYTLQGEVVPNWDVITTLSYTQPYVKVGGNGYTAGHLLGGVPERQFNFWGTYKFQRQSLRGLKIGAGANWVASSAQPFTQFETPAYWIAALMGSYEHQLGGYKTSLQLNINNVLNKNYFTNIYVYSNNIEGYNYGAPTEYRLSARVEF